MAVQATESERMDLKLSAIAAEIDGLPDVKGEWPQMLDDHQAAFLLEWDEALARMESLERAFRAHELSQLQQSQYRLLLRKFEEAAPIIRRLGLAEPRLAPSQ